MRIAILGTGAIGSLFATGLSEKHDVTCIVKSQAHADSINKNGITITEKDGTTRTVHPAAFTNTENLGAADIVLIAVKAQVTAEAVGMHKNLFGPETIAVTLQNGYGNHKDIETVVQPEHIVIGTTSHGVNIGSDGSINHAGAGVTTIGALVSAADGSSEKMLETVASVFNDAGFETVITADAQDAVIRKLFINIGINAVCTLNDAQNKYINTNPQMRMFSRQLVEEAVLIFDIAGRPYDKDEIWQTVQDTAEKTGSNICSMLQDVRNGRETEIRRINGAVVELAHSFHIDAPLNRDITSRIEILTSH